MPQILTYQTGKIFPPALIWAGYIVLAAGILTLVGLPPVGVIVIAASIYISFSFAGSQLDVQQRAFRLYNSYFWIKTGQWKSLDNYPDIAILTRREVTTMYGLSSLSSSAEDEHQDICLLNQTHRIKHTIVRCKNRKEAIEEAQKIADALGLRLTTYQPKISDKTRERRSKRR